MTLIELFRLLPESLDISIIEYNEKYKCTNKTSCSVIGFMKNEGFSLNKEISKIEPNFIKQIGIQSLNVYVKSDLELSKNDSSNLATWDMWGGWKGNHDRIIEDARCSKCGYKHPTVKKSLSFLSKVCEKCGSVMASARYENGEIEPLE